MKKWFEKLLPNGKGKVGNLAAALSIGVLLIICGNVFFTGGTNEEQKDFLADVLKEEKQQTSPQQPSQRAAPTQNISHEAALERRLENILRTVEGVGNVRVMITLSAGAERVFAENIVRSESMVNETDSQGGRREQNDSNSQFTKIFQNSKDGGGQPIIIKEYEPVVEGVIISASGGADAAIKAEITQAAQTVLGVEAHKVAVLKMGNPNK